MTTSSNPSSQKDKTIKRLNRVAGQVHGVARMIDEDRYCIEVLNQVQAIKAALARAESEILKAHAETCVENAIASGNEKNQREKVSELIDLFAKLKR